MWWKRKASNKTRAPQWTPIWCSENSSSDGLPCGKRKDALVPHSQKWYYRENLRQAKSRQARTNGIRHWQEITGWRIFGELYIHTVAVGTAGRNAAWLSRIVVCSHKKAGLLPGVNHSGRKPAILSLSAACREKSAAISVIVYRPGSMMADSQVPPKAPFLPETVQQVQFLSLFSQA